MELLKHVEKPARYTGGELNSVVKEEAKLSFALLFADVYEVGMSHLGLQILYEVLNGKDYIQAERVFCPWVDMMDKMREAGKPLRSLETGKALSDFDIAGFNLSYEMGYSNVLAMLDLGGIPLLAAERKKGFPLVIGGGACTVNPEPLADFFDLFVIGEGEEVTLELCALYLKHKQAGFEKNTFLLEAAQLQGIYVPSLYDVFYNDDGTVREITAKAGAPEKIRRRFVANFDVAKAVEKPVLPFINTVHDRCVLEIMRGCSNGCRFCQAGYTMRPVRERSKHRLMEQAESIIRATGYDEISLSSLSSGDYSEINPLIEELINEFAQKRVSVSLPSQRLNTFAFSEALQQVRKTGLTFAPEAGTQRLRDIINKNITDADIMNALEQAFLSGVSSVKLYFMIGLPFETQEDIEGIASLVKEIRSLFYSIPKEKRARHINITVSASCFVPKACTPFMWAAQDSLDTLRQKQIYLKDALRIKGVKFSYHDAKLSFLEAVLARGDRRLGAVLQKAYELGARFCAWQEHFSFERYMQAFEESGTDPDFYACRERSEDEVMPFDHIDMLISKEYLLREKKKAADAVSTPECRETCAACGLQKNGCEMHRKDMPCG